jgi:predicted NACHT family NTPase
VSIKHLCDAAFNMMKNDTRVITYNELSEILPEFINNQQRDIFIKEMVLKTGVLYESEGKYAFLHLTFQEFLAAKYFASNHKPGEILKYADKSYFKETILLYVNIIENRSKHMFFDYITDNLMTADLWKNLDLWEDCLSEITDHDIKDKLEIEFAKKVLDICTTNDRLNEQMQIYFTFHDPVYKHARQFSDYGRKLLKESKYPFLSSLGSSILFKCDTENRNALFEYLCDKIAKADPSDEQKNSIFWRLTAILLHCFLRQKI